MTRSRCRGQHLVLVATHEETAHNAERQAADVYGDAQAAHRGAPLAGSIIPTKADLVCLGYQYRQMTRAGDPEEDMFIAGVSRTLYVYMRLP